MKAGIGNFAMIGSDVSGGWRIATQVQHARA